MQADGLSLDLTRVLPATRERVFASFADAARALHRDGRTQSFDKLRDLVAAQP